MELRAELLPPRLDEALVHRLAHLADALDGAAPEQCEEDLAEFNRLAGTALAFADFQGIYGGEEHETWVRRIVRSKMLRPVADVTREELAEVVRRAMPQNEDPDYEAYMAIFDANVPRPHASNLIFYSADYNHNRDWQSEYDPTPEEIVDQALSYKVVALPPPRPQGSA